MCGAGKKIGSGTGVAHAAAGDAFSAAVHSLLFRLALEQSGTAMLHEPGDETGGSAVAVSHVLRALALEQSGTATLHEPGDETGASAVAVSHVLSALALARAPWPGPHRWASSLLAHLVFSTRQADTPPTPRLIRRSS